MESEGLKPTEFANKIQVQRSGISHILTGRNRPSLDVVQKILTTFSNLNSDWLLFGRGSMYNDGSDPEKRSTPSSDAIQETLDLDDNPPKEESQPKPQPEGQNTHTPNPPKPPEDSNQNTDSQDNMPNKRIAYILIFYTDGTFKEFRPS